MPQYVEVKGNVIEFPDGMPPSEIESAIKANMLSIKPAASVQAGQAINSIPRQVGLTVRHGIEGLAEMTQVFTEPIRGGLGYLANTTPPELRPSGWKQPDIRPTRETVSSLLDSAGLPKPQNANERVIGDATRLVAGAGGLGGAAQLATRLPGLAGHAASFLSANMPQQLASAAGAGVAGGASREAGGGTGMQVTASVLGAIAGGGVPNTVNSATQAVKGAFNRLTPQQIDAQLTLVFNRAGQDYSQVPEAVRQSLRAELAASLQAGRELDPAAVARLADFRTVGATPTRGMVSQNPVQITREMNLAKVGANSGDETLQGLALTQNRNNETLIRNLNQAGANRGDPFRAGQTAIDSIQGRNQAMEGAVSGLYQQARDSSGRAAPMDGAAFTRAANAALDESMLGYALPQSVQNRMNQIARGEVPFTVDFAEQFKKNLNQLHSSTNDRAVQRAISTVRRALDDTPLTPAPPVNAGNLPAVPGTVPPSPAVVGREALDAFDQARQAARARFQWAESGRPVEAALNGAQPDRFVQQFVIKGTVGDAENVARNAPVAEVKDAIVAHLKERALNGAADEVGKFSQSAYNKALREIGDRKLALFFSREELAQLRAVGRVASYMQNQPVGSAVNNSNSGALLLGRGYDALRGIAGKVPFGQSLILDPLQNIEVSLRSGQAMNVAPGLLAPVRKPPVSQGLLLPGLAAAGGLLSAP